MTSNNELPIGTTLRGGSYTYTIERVLGQGTFGITYLATTKVKADGALGALEATLHVAIKEFFMHDLNGRHGAEVTCSSKSGIYEHYRHKFAREAQNLSKLHHPHIVRVLESFEGNNTAYYAMEFCEGGSLDALIGGNGLAEGQAVAYAEQIGAALVAMHGERVLHLDLKPGNVMLRKDGSVALIDFGLSKQYDESGEPESSTTVGGGTPGYAPLEQAHYREGKDFPVQMDIYALGATLFKMLTGERPAEAAMLLNEGFPTEKLTAKGVSELTIAVVEKAMSPMKRDRYSSVADFLAALDGVAGEQPSAPAPEEETSYDDPAVEVTVVDEEPEAVPTKEIKSESVTTEEPSIPSKKRGSKKGLWITLITILSSILLGGVVWLWEPWIERFDHDDFRCTGELYNHYDYVDLGLSVQWATCNVGASNPSEYGNYYAWGETRSKSEYNSPNSATYEKPMGDIAGNPNYDAARANWGGSWRLPTKAEFQELVDDCSWKWGVYLGVKGYKVTGPNGNSIFLPAAGWRYGSSLYDAGEYGYYWSSTPLESGSQRAYDLTFDSGNRSVLWFSRLDGHTVRPVSE